MSMSISACRGAFARKEIHCRPFACEEGWPFFPCGHNFPSVAKASNVADTVDKPSAQ